MELFISSCSFNINNYPVFNHCRCSFSRSILPLECWFFYLLTYDYFVSLGCYCEWEISFPLYFLTGFYSLHGSCGFGVVFLKHFLKISFRFTTNWRAVQSFPMYPSLPPTSPLPISLDRMVNVFGFVFVLTKDETSLYIIITLSP